MTAEYNISHFQGKFESEQEAETTGLKGWSDLVTRGYGFEGDSEYASLQFAIEYTKSPKGIIIVFHKDTFVCASLVLNPTDIFGEYKSYGVHGVVVLPELKGQGIGKRLYKEAGKILSPDTISGSTKTPSSVVARAKGLIESGMRTFYGNFEVTDETRSGYTTDHQFFLNAYLKNKEQVGLNYSVVIARSVDTLLPDVPKLDNYSDYIKEAFIPVIKTQTEWESTKTAVMPLISIKEDLL